MGFGNLAFAGGRDTIIHIISSIVAHFGRDPAALDYLRDDPRRIVHAGEEFFRAFTPLTHLGRVCPSGSSVRGVIVPPGGRVSLCWASANFDEAHFVDPERFDITRSPNEHLAFGFGPHVCLGASLARVEVQSMVGRVLERLPDIELAGDARPAEFLGGLTELPVRFSPTAPSL